MAEPRKVIYGVHIHDEKCKKKAMKAISSVKDKVCETELLVVEVVKQEEKKEEPKKEEPKKEEEKKEPNETYRVWNYEPHYNPRMPQGGYYVIMEENPNPNCCLIS
uniref:uncharacterized protein LOC122580496 isoform X3 n=1 Tax=Erigeron canadensis TaxID=72917 RepID=UPI001CB9445D|nr:uncharacterized protein LOC122580496 isoform X3 [Erigeron canadensis]